MDALAFMVSARAARRRASVGCVGLWGKVGVALRPQPPPGKRLALACDVIARKAAAQAQCGLGSAADRTGRRPKLGAVGPATHRGTANAAPLPRTVKTQSPSSPWPRTQDDRAPASAWLLRIQLFTGEMRKKAWAPKRGRAEGLQVKGQAVQADLDLDSGASLGGALQATFCSPNGHPAVYVVQTPFKRPKQTFGST
jgi:hypothetical protein